MFEFIRKLIEDRRAGKRVRQDKERALTVIKHMFAVHDGSADYEIAHLAGYHLGSAEYEAFVADLVARDLIRLYQKGEQVYDEILTIPKYFPTRTARSFAGIAHMSC